MQRGAVIAMIRLVAVSLAVGAVVGAAIWLFLFLMDIGITVLWGASYGTLGALRSIVICIVGGIVIGWCSSRFRTHPEELLSVVSELRTDGRYEYRGLWKRFVLSLFALVFGGSVGPEAGLTGVVAGMGTWAGDKVLVTASRGGDAEGTRRVGAGMKVTIVILAAVGAVSALAVLMFLVGGGMSVPRYPDVGYGIDEVVWTVPMVLAGVLAGYLFRCSDIVFERISGRIGDRPMTKAVSVGIVLAVCGVVLPYTLFSGEAHMESLFEDWIAIPAFLLLVSAIVKIVVTAMCINMEWRGGQFFPLVFAGISLGYGMSAILGLDPVYCLCACTSALIGSVLGRWPLTVLLLLLCFPLNAVPVLLVAAIAGSKIPFPESVSDRLSRGRRPPRGDGPSGDGSPRRVIVRARSP